MDMPGIVNTRLMLKASKQDFIQRGFIETDDGSGSPWGIDWTLQRNNFRIWIDPTFVVHLSRVNPDTDSIKVLVEDLADLDSLLDWVADDEVAA